MASTTRSDRNSLGMAVKDEADTDNAVPSDTECSGMSDLVRRHGIRELGWFAHEKAMPAKVLSRIEAGDAIEICGIITVLARLSEQDPSVKTAYFCHSSVQYITKLKGEGSFCGYRNIQMLISYILGSTSQHTKNFADGVPSILQLQDLIEDAWDQGINSQGRIETGGIRGTRKHIGTPEAQALFRSVGIPCSVGTYQSSSDGPSAWNLLLENVKRHFEGTSSSFLKSKVHPTNLPPIYLQRPRHSLTVVGFETRTDGKNNLLVLDPGLRPSPRIVRATQAAKEGTAFDKRITLRPYRRGKWQLAGYKQFETLTVDVQCGG